MRYISTRNSSNLSYTFEQALCSGYAPDGGLFVPESLPSVTAETLQKWSQLSYPVLAQQVMRLYCSKDEVSDDSLAKCCESAFCGFTDPARAVPLVRLGSDSMWIAELFHGPTFCFKDLGMRTVVNLLSHFATKRSRAITLLVSTTGDTGPAAVQAVSDCNNPLLTILIHYPNQQISEFQRRQMTTVGSTCVHVAAFEGGGDDMDLPIKRMLTGRRTDDALWTGVNSYNIGRPLMQMVHFIWTYLRVSEAQGIPFGDVNQPVDIILPTGAMGNIAGGYMAKKMGIPLGKLTAGVNANDITHRVIQKGDFGKRPMIRTLSEAINIQVPYNFERLLFYLSDQNASQVRQWMTHMDSTGQLTLDAVWLEKLQVDFDSASVTDDEMCATIRAVWRDFDYLVDPHTAVALAAANVRGYPVYTTTSGNTSTASSRSLDCASRVASVVLATASPCKFEESMTVAIGSKEWEAYRASETYPITAAEIMAKTERPPTIYHALHTLEESQVKWEATARGMMHSLGKMNLNQTG
jgi:threonine synthase